MWISAYFIVAYVQFYAPAKFPSSLQNVYAMLVACLSSIVANLMTFNDISPPTLTVVLLAEPQNKVIFRSEQDLLHMSDVCSNVMP